MNHAKHIRKPMPAPTSAHKGVKDSPRSKAVDLSEWYFDEPVYRNEGLDWDDAPPYDEHFTEGRSWSA